MITPWKNRVKLKGNKCTGQGLSKAQTARNKPGNVFVVLENKEKLFLLSASAS
jgi:hypothetical protein